VKTRFPRISLTLSIVLNVCLLALLGHGMAVRDTHADVGEPEELVPYMETMHSMSHKLGLSIQAKNQPLAAFYLEEIEETVLVIQKKFPTYDKMQISALAGAMFVPSIEPLEKSINAKSWAVATAGYTKLIDSCNGCHAATTHSFIQVTAPTSNPFNQTFSPK
jgi:hypothetical protein